MADLLDLATAALSRSAMNIVNGAARSLTGTAVNALTGGISADPLGCGTCPPMSYGGKLTGLNDPCGKMNTPMNNVLTKRGLDGAGLGGLGSIDTPEYDGSLLNGGSSDSDTGAGCCLLRLFDDYNPIPDGSDMMGEILGFQNEFDEKRTECAVLVIKDGSDYYVYGYSDGEEWSSATPTSSGLLIDELDKVQRERDRNAITAYALSEIDKTAPECVLSGVGSSANSLSDLLDSFGGNSGDTTDGTTGNATDSFDVTDAGDWFDSAQSDLSDWV